MAQRKLRAHGEQVDLAAAGALRDLVARHRLAQEHCKSKPDSSRASPGALGEMAGLPGANREP